MRPTPTCDRCESTETMEHLQCECENYTIPLWTKLADSWTRLLNDNSLEPVPRVELGQTNVIYSIPHPSLILHIHDQATRNALLLLVQEVKRDIIYRRMNLPPSAQQPTDPRRITAHIDSAIKRLCSYPGIHRICQIFQGYHSSTASARTQPCLRSSLWGSMLTVTNLHDASNPSHANTITLPHVHSLHTQHSCKKPTTIAISQKSALYTYLYFVTSLLTHIPNNT
jgi:hypothetical protein